MSTEGLVFKDLLPIPDTDPTEHEGKATTILDAPTESHALALESAKATTVEEKGAAQIAHSEEVVNLGWNEPKEQVLNPLVGGLANEELWLLVRRFNKVTISTLTTVMKLMTCSKCTMSKKFKQQRQEDWT